jgi:hypothetical protein
MLLVIGKTVNSTFVDALDGLWGTLYQSKMFDWWHRLVSRQLTPQKVHTLWNKVLWERCMRLLAAVIVKWLRMSKFLLVVDMLSWIRIWRYIMSVISRMWWLHEAQCIAVDNSLDFFCQLTITDQPLISVQCLIASLIVQAEFHVMLQVHAHFGHSWWQGYCLFGLCDCCSVMNKVTGKGQCCL